MGDDDDLRLLSQLFEQAEQSAQVHVVEGGLHLVHDVERRWTGTKDRDQHRHRGQRLLATGEQRQSGNLLARRAGFDLDAGGEHVVGLGQPQPSFTTGEQCGEHAAKFAFHVYERVIEHLQDAGVNIGDDAQQILAGSLDILELGGQEIVALLQGSKLFERQRVDPAQLGKRTLGAFGPALLGNPVERHGGGRNHLLAAFAGLLELSHLELGRW